jgi:hypothetical protein
MAEVASQAKSFRWSELESADYRTYVANLRGIGCPEQTIRDIITADVGSLYSERIRTLESKLAEAGTADQSAVEGEIRAVRREKAWLLSTLLGTEPIPGDDSAEGVAGNAAPRTVRLLEPGKVPVPLVFQPVDFGAANLDPGQIQAITGLRERFIEEIGVQDPNDPAYRERWLRAQPQSDKELQAVIGLLAYRHFEISARVAAASQGSPVSE